MIQEGLLAGEREIHAALDLFVNAECLIGRVTDLTTFEGPEGPVSLVTLHGEDERGNRRVVVANGASVRMFPAFLCGLEIRVVCRADAVSEYRTLYNFLELAHVMDLTDDEGQRLWPWRSAAYRVLRDPYIQMSQFEEAVCKTLSTSGRPPSLKQRSIFERVEARGSSSGKRLTRDSLWRAERHKPRLETDGPFSLGEALLHYLDKLHQIWLAAPN